MNGTKRHTNPSQHAAIRSFGSSATGLVVKRADVSYMLVQRLIGKTIDSPEVTEEIRAKPLMIIPRSKSFKIEATHTNLLQFPGVMALWDSNTMPVETFIENSLNLFI